MDGRLILAVVGIFAEWGRAVNRSLAGHRDRCRRTSASERPYFVRAEGVAFERPDGSYVSPAHVPFASEVLAKVRTFDGLIGALEQPD